MANVKKIAIAALLVQAALAPICAESNMIVQHYTVEEGLPSNTVYCSIKDSDGFLWFGTWYGLCSFDGGKFTPFVTRTRQISDIPPRKVISLVEDGKGYLWVRTVDNRLYLYDKRADTYHEVYDELKQWSPNVQVIKIQRADNGNMLLLTRNKSLHEAHVDDKGHVVVERILDSAALIDPVTFRLQHNVLGVSEKYIYWLGTDFKLDVVARPRGRRYLSIVKPNKAYDYYRRRGDSLFVGTQGGEHYVINAKTGDLHQGTGPENADFIDKTGSAWRYEQSTRQLVCTPADGHAAMSYAVPQGENVATLQFCDAGENGLFVLHATGDVWHYDRHAGTMSNVADYRQFGAPAAGRLHFFDMELDREGLLWLSSTGNGVYRVNFPPSNFKFFRPEMFSQTGTTSDGQGIRAIYQQRNGDLWVGLRNGTLMCIDHATGQPKATPVGQIGNVYHVCEDHGGNLWLSTKGNGLFKLVKATGEVLHYAPSPDDAYAISDERVYYVYEDSHQRIWVCTFGGGLNLIDEREGRTRFIHRGNEMKNYPGYDLYLNARAITEDDKGRFWVGTTDGLMSFADGFSTPSDINFEIYREQEDAGTVDNDVFALYKDSGGRIWMGMFGGGLNLLEDYDSVARRPLLKNFPFAEQQDGNVVAGIIEDHNHRLWLSTENGLAGLDPAHETIIRNYDRFSGFPAVSVEDNTIACIRDGRVLIGCRQGIIAFSPEDVVNEGIHRYPLFVVDFRVQNKALGDFSPPIYEGSVRYAREIVLRHDQNMFAVEFASLNYIDHNQTAYAYILEGYERQWHESGNNRNASYANVPPGHYTFRVKAQGAGEGELALQIRVLPPWWATGWAYAVYALLLLALIYGAFRLAGYLIRMRNETYVNDRLAELKIRFFTNVSHELRTPLTLIKSPIEELKKRERLTPEGREYLSLIDSNAKKMLQLVNQILDFRKVQNGKMELHTTLTDLNALLETLQQEYRVHAKDRDISYEFQLPEEHILAVCDAQKMGVVMNNLVNNAFKYTPEGGNITVSLEENDDRSLAVIRVEDDGANIPEDKLEAIFERFAQADNRADDTSVTGTGIGLSLSREFMQMHGGTIRAENQERGVAFIVELPLNNKREESTNEGNDTAAATADDQPSTLNDRLPTLLLVEDNVDLCRMLCLQLQDKYNMLTAHDGEEGLKKVYQYHPDIVVSDLMMPRMDGMELLRRLRRDFNVSHIPVIILTAKQGDEVHMQTIEAGANAYITKPFSGELLQARINQLLEEQRIFQRKMVLSAEKNGAAAPDDSDYENHLVKKDIEFVRRVNTVIEENLKRDDFNINTLAEEMGLSRSAFFKKLKSLTGFAPADLVKEVRLAKALSLVETTDMTVAEMAYAVGFRDPGYFTKCFRQKYGDTPKEHRAKQKPAS